MNLKGMNTDQLADLYVEIAPIIERITEDDHWEEIAKAAEGGLTAKKMLAVILPLLLKYNRADVFSIIGAANGKTADEVAKQPFPKTLAMARDLVTTDFGDFFSQSESEEQAG